MSTLEKIALEKLKKQIDAINQRVLDYQDSPDKLAMYVLPFMKGNINTAYEIIEALEKT